MNNKRANKKKNRNGKRASRGRGGGLPVLSCQFGTRNLSPPTKTISLGYQTRISLTEPTAGAGVTYAFRLNSLYDPDATGAGSQPAWFDQISAMYGQFRVKSAKVRFQIQSATATSPEIVGAFASYQAVAPSDPMSWAVQPFAVSKVLGNSGSGQCGADLKFKVRISDVLGVTAKEFASDFDFVCTASGNPTRQAYLMVYVAGIGSVVCAAVFVMTIQYEVECMQPLALGLS